VLDYLINFYYDLAHRHVIVNHIFLLDFYQEVEHVHKISMLVSRILCIFKDLKIVMIAYLI